MRKLIYILLFSVVSSLSIMSCTEEEVHPSSNAIGTDGKESDPK